MNVKFNLPMKNVTAKPLNTRNVQNEVVIKTAIELKKKKK